jgi:hypothetical protein
MIIPLEIPSNHLVNPLIALGLHEFVVHSLVFERLGGHDTIGKRACP